MIKIANAPCSWGVLEFEDKGRALGIARCSTRSHQPVMSAPSLATGVSCRPAPRQLRAELGGRDLGMVGAFVTTRLVDSRSYGASRERAVATARLLAAVAAAPPPVIVLSDEPTADPHRARAAGRVTPNLSLPAEWWHEAADGIDRDRPRRARRNRAAHGVPSSLRDLRRDAAGDRCADAGARIPRSSACVSTPAMRPTAAARRWICSNATAIASGTSTSRTASRTSPRARAQEEWDYQTALRHGVFCELGKGSVDFAAAAAGARALRLRRLDRGRAGRPAGHGRAGSTARGGTGSICGRLGF